MIYGLLLGIAIMVVLFLCVLIGYKLNHKQEKLLQTREEIERLRKRDEGISNVMDYDYNVALGKRVSK